MGERGGAGKVWLSRRGAVMPRAMSDGGRAAIG